MRERNSERSAACGTCGKTFARSDTLLRHEKSHLATEDRGPVHRVTNGTFRACSSCAQARSRCSGGYPCGRCKVRDLDCTYPAKRRKASNTKDEDDSPVSSLIFQTLPAESKKQASEYPHAAQFQQVVFTETSGHQDHRTTTTNQHPAQLSNQSPGIQYVASLHQPSIQLESPLMTRSSIEAIPRTDSSDLTTAQYGNPTHNGLSTNFDVNQSVYGFDTGYDESAGLNWLPLSVYPSPYNGDLEHDFAFLLPSFQDATNLGMSYTPATSYGQDVANALALPAADIATQNMTPDTQNSSLMVGSAQSPASTTSDALSGSRVLQDSSALETRKKHRKPQYVQDAFTRLQSFDAAYEFPHNLHISPRNITRMLCSDAQYASILTAFQHLCSNPLQSKPFGSQHFPPLAFINYLLDLYFEKFHQTFPLLHAPTFGPNRDWILVLAAAAVGSNHSTQQNSVQLREAFAEFLRRAITTLDGEGLSISDIDLIQAKILNLINLSQADRPQARSMVPRYHAELSRWNLESGLLLVSDADEPSQKSWTSAEQVGSWHTWIQRETRRRIGYFIWLLDCALGYLCNSRPLCNMDDARAPLPCTESIWDAPSERAWVEIKSDVPPPSLCTALEALYNSKKVSSGLGDFAHILLIHALYSRTWEVGTHIKQPLSEWKSTSAARGFLNTPSKDNFWLPLYPLYANWRNSACDCLDVLHWHASSVIARASGVEHHGVLQLHLARIILLTPFQEIQDLLFFLINQHIGDESQATFYVHDGSYQRRNPAKFGQIRKITWRWLREDQHKARLAMIHAGSVFWHVKRYSTNSFFEPLAVYLASIVLWTYGSYKSAALEREAADVSSSKAASTAESYSVQVQPSRVEIAAQQRDGTVQSNTDLRSSVQHSDEQRQAKWDANESNNSLSDECDQDLPEFIHLDRPCDDEIVQHFVRNGHNMSGYLSNGDICKTPGKVLSEGAKLLKSKLGCWGVSRAYYDILCKVGEAGKRNTEISYNDTQE